MSRLAYWGQRPAWLMLAGDVGGENSVLSGAAYRTELSMQYGLYVSSVTLTAELDKAMLRTGQRQQGEPAPLEALMWEALQEWPDENAGRRWPPEMEALLALARKYPEEYRNLRDAEAVLRALGGLSWGHQPAAIPLEPGPRLPEETDMALSKRADPDGTFAVLDAKGNPVAIGLGEGMADARLASEAGDSGPADGSSQGSGSDPAGAKDGGQAKGGSRTRKGKS